MSGDELAAFVLARVAEDEASARGSVADAGTGRTLGVPPEWLHGVAARVLAECEAKRRIVESAVRDLAKADARDADQIVRSFSAGAAFVAHNTLLTLAAVWADHPDYRPEWRP